MSSQESDLNDYLKSPEFDKDGLLMKLSSKNVWQKRYYQLRGPYLMYWGSASGVKKNIEKGNVVGTPGVSIDLRLIREAEIFSGGVLILTSKSNQLFSLKSVNNNNDIKEWLDKIDAQLLQEQEIRKSQSFEVQKAKDARPTVFMSHESTAYDEEPANEETTEEEARKEELNALNALAEKDENDDDEEGDEEVQKKTNEDEILAATKVQSITRQKLSQKKVNNIREEKIKQEQATLKIQNLSRKKTAMKKVEAKRNEKKEDEKQIIKIQGLIRQKDAKKRVDNIRDEKQQNEGDKPVEEANETTTNDDSDVEKFASNYRGLLEKAGHFVNTGYKTRMFVLSKDQSNYNYWSLNYYVDEGMGRLGEKKGDIILKDSIIETNNNANNSSPKKKENSSDQAEGGGGGADDENNRNTDADFTIVSTDKTFPLRAPSPEVAQEWIKRLRYAIKENDNNKLANTNLNNSTAINRLSNGEAIAQVVGDGNTGGPSYRGVLEKAGHFINTSYKSRLFVLAATPPANDWVLFYYLDEGGGRLGELKGEIILKNATLEQSKGCDFTVITSNKTFPLRANDEENAKIWKEKIAQAIELSSSPKVPVA
jgi:hypothetical protein